MLCFREQHRNMARTWEYIRLALIDFIENSMSLDEKEGAGGLAVLVCPQGSGKKLDDYERDAAHPAVPARP